MPNEFFLSFFYFAQLIFHATPISETHTFVKTLVCNTIKILLEAVYPQLSVQSRF